MTNEQCIAVAEEGCPTCGSEPKQKRHRFCSRQCVYLWRRQPDGLRQLEVGAIFQCSRCSADVVLTEARKKHRSRKCAKCKTKVTNDLRLQNINEYRGKDRARCKVYYENNKNRLSQYHKERRLKFPERHKANDLVNKAIKNGEMKRGPCVVCGTLKSEGHHEDYSKPLDVVWLCAVHHAQHHAALAVREEK